MSIKYKSGYKYQLVEEAREHTPILGLEIKTEYVSLYRDGLMVFRKGYAWDGASGPTLDTKSSMRASLVHDGFYQLMRLELLPILYREKVDQLFHRMCIDDGMDPFRAWYWYKAVRLFAGESAQKHTARPILTAP